MKKILVFISLIIFLILSAFVPLGVIDNSLEVWIDHNTPEGKKWQEFVHEFGSSEFIVVAVNSMSDIFEKNSIEKLEELENNLERLPFVDAVVGPGKIYRQLFVGNDIAGLKHEITQSPFYQNLLVGKDQKSLGIFLHLKKIPHQPSARIEITDAVEREISLASQKSPELKFHIAGPPVLNAYLDRISQASSQKLIPACIIVVLIWMILMVRSWWSACMVLLAIGLSIGATMGLMVILKTPVNMLTISLPGLLMILNVSGSVHIVHRFQELSRQKIETGSAILITMNELKRPCCEATITTIVGFLSLVVSSMPAVRQLGIFTSIGLSFGLIANLCLIPHFLNVRWNRIPQASRMLDIPALKLGFFGYRHYRLVNFIVMMIFLIILCVSSFYEIEANTLKFLPPEHKVVQDSEFIANNLTGLYSLELDITIESGEPIPWKWLEDISRYLEKNPAVSRVYGPTDLLKKMNSIAENDWQAYNLPENDEVIELMIVSMEKMLSQEWQRICKNNDRHIRISILVNAMNSNVYRKIFEDIDTLTSSCPRQVTLHTTGIITLVIRSERELIQTQLQSFGLSALIICIMMASILRKKYMILAAIPDNLLPPLVAFATMVALGIKINAGTVIVASIGIGLAVDNTIHICRRLDSISLKGNRMEDALSECLKIAGSPMIATSVIIGVGFSVLLMAEFRPLMYFGGLTVVCIFSALLCDLIWLPAMLRAFLPRKLQTSFPIAESTKNSVAKQDSFPKE